jgi:hypothetical protein
MRTQAAAYVDAEFRRTQDDLFTEHRRQEQRQLAWHKDALQSFGAGAVAVIAALFLLPSAR